MPPNDFVIKVSDRHFGTTSETPKIKDSFDALEQSFEAELTVSFSFWNSKRRTPASRWRRDSISNDAIISSCECVLAKDSIDILQFTLFCSTSEFRIPTIRFAQNNASVQESKRVFKTVVRCFDPLYANCRNENRFDLWESNSSEHYLTIPSLRTFTYFGKRYIDHVFHGTEHVRNTPGCLVESFLDGFLLDLSEAETAEVFHERREIAQRHLLPHPIWGDVVSGSRALSDALFFGTSFEAELHNQTRDPKSNHYGTPEFREDLHTILEQVEERLSKAHLNRRTIHPMMAERNPQGGEVLFAEYRSYPSVETLHEMTRREAKFRSPRVICFVLAYPATIERDGTVQDVFVEEVRDEWFRLRETFCLEKQQRPRRLASRHSIRLDGYRYADTTSLHPAP